MRMSKDAPSQARSRNAGECRKNGKIGKISIWVLDPNQTEEGVATRTRPLVSFGRSNIAIPVGGNAPFHLMIASLKQKKNIFQLTSPLVRLQVSIDPPSSNATGLEQEQQRFEMALVHKKIDNGVRDIMFD